MIPRYSRPEMVLVWEPKTRFEIWLDIERYACEAQEKLGVIPSGVAQALVDRGKFEIDKINTLERELKHDVIAFLTNLSEYVGSEARFIHQGLTSSDVLDTAFAVQLTRAADILMAGLDSVCTVLDRRAHEYKDTECVGRSHGIHAEPTTFGLKLAYAYAEFDRARSRLRLARQEIAVCTISGAVGTYSTVNPAVESHVAKKLGLSPETISTQVMPRDRHAMFFATLGVIAGSVERLATEIRHLQRTEVGEAEEFFEPGQKGSSAMPHKRNPILTENLTGLARIVRATVQPALENIALWHERDISHSSVERVIGPDATITLDFALSRISEVMNTLLVYPDTMRKNLDQLGGLIHSQRVLLALTQAGLSREDAYRIVQRNAIAVWRSGGTFLECLIKDQDITSQISASELKEIFETQNNVRYIDEIFARVFQK